MVIWLCASGVTVGLWLLDRVGTVTLAGFYFYFGISGFLQGPLDRTYASNLAFLRGFCVSTFDLGVRIGEFKSFCRGKGLGFTRLFGFPKITHLKCLVAFVSFGFMIVSHVL